MNTIAPAVPRNRESKQVAENNRPGDVGARLRGHDVARMASAGAILLALPLLIGAVASHGAAQAASSKADWSNEDCPEKTQARWCAPMMRSGGWQLKYRSTQPEDMPDVFWTIEVWVKGPDALVCELKGGRGGIRSNGCYSAVEVPGGK